MTFQKYYVLLALHLLLNKRFTAIFHLLLQTHLQRSFLAQVPYIQGPHAASKAEKDCIVGQLTQAYYESANNLECTPLVPTIPKEAIIRSAPSQPPMTLAVMGPMDCVATKNSFNQFLIFLQFG
jgi:hypothetical protein